MVKVHSLGDLTSWRDIQVGKLFYVMLGRNMCLGMKVEGELEPGDEPYEACVILTPSKERGTPHEYDHEHQESSTA